MKPDQEGYIGASSCENSTRRRHHDHRQLFHKNPRSQEKEAVTQRQTFAHGNSDAGKEFVIRELSTVRQSLIRLLIIRAAIM